MMYLKQKLALFLGALCLCLAPVQTALAADQARSATAADAGFAFKVAYNRDRYEVFMRPNATADALNLTLTAQVTLKVPHATGAARFNASDVQNGVDGAVWSVTSRVDAPAEDPTADYISFTVEFPEGNHNAYGWQADQELKVFSFANSGACLGAVSLLENSDPFMAPVNSANTNPGNQINVLGYRDSNLFLGAYDGAATCAATPQAAQHLFLPFVNR